MRSTRAYTFSAGDALTQRHFRIEANPRTTTVTALTAVSAQSTASGGLCVTYTLSASADVEMEVLNIAGRMIARIPVGISVPGTRTAAWSGRNASGSKAPPGLYLVTVRCHADDGTETTRCVKAFIR
jgi:flagellar hook assembly protein FlgD